MKIREILKLTSDFFLSNHIENPELDAEVLFLFVSDWTKEKLLCELNSEVSEKIKFEYRNVVRLRAKHIPISYITKSKFFWDMEFFINEFCLIPRPETEQIIELVVNEFSDRPYKIKILDLCCGPGTIILTLLNSLKNSIGTAVDYSSEVLSVLYENAENYGLLGRLEIIKSDLKKKDFFLNHKNKYDVIVCNPPYISELEYKNLSIDVKYEPKSALIAEEEGLYFYKLILNYVEIFLEKNGILYFEISENIIINLIKFIESLNKYKFHVYNGLNNKPNILKICIC